MKTRPVLDIVEAQFWEAFHTLHLSRASTGLGPGAIPLSEIRAYADLMQMPPGDVQQEFMRVMRAMDRAYLEQVTRA